MSERPAAPRSVRNSDGDPLFRHVRTVAEYESDYRVIRRLLISGTVSLGFARKRLQSMQRDLLFLSKEQNPISRSRGKVIKVPA